MRGIPRAFTNVVEGISIGHRYSLWGVRVRISCRWLQSSLSADLSKGIFERGQSIDRCEFVGDLVDECGSFDSGFVSLGRLDRGNANLAFLMLPTVPTIP